MPATYGTEIFLYSASVQVDDWGWAAVWSGSTQGITRSELLSLHPEGSKWICIPLFFEKSSDNFTPWHPRAQTKALLRSMHHEERRRTPFEKVSHQVENPTPPGPGRSHGIFQIQHSTAVFENPAVSWWIWQILSQPKEDERSIIGGSRLFLFRKEDTSKSCYFSTKEIWKDFLSQPKREKN